MEPDKFARRREILDEVNCFAKGDVRDVGVAAPVLCDANYDCRLTTIGMPPPDCKANALLLERLPDCRLVLTDKSYNSDAVRWQIQTAGAASNTLPKINRRWKPRFSPVLYRGRTAIVRTFGRLKDFRRIATRYDRLARNYLSALCLAAAVRYCL